jgi:uncharacterized phage protein gp47/JayE
MLFQKMTTFLSRMIDSVLTNTNEINDFSVGSASRAILEAVSIELEQFTMLTRENNREAIKYGVYTAFDFRPKPPVRAFGPVEIRFHNPTQQDAVLPRGSRFMSNDSRYPHQYETLIDFYIPQGATLAEIEVYCRQRGTVGNIPQNVINVMHSPLYNVESVTNPTAFTTGQNEEPLSELHARFNAHIESVGRATLKAVEYSIRSVDEVSGVNLTEKPGRVTAYVHDRNGHLSEYVQSKVIDSLQEYRAAGVFVEVLPVKRKEIELEVEVTLRRRSQATAVFRREVEDAIKGYISGLTVSQDLILSSLTYAIRHLDRSAIYDVKVKVPEGNVRVSGSEIIRTSSVKVTLK